MSDTAPLTVDRAATIRDLAVATLIAYGTIAGSAIEAERVEQIDATDMPRVAVMADDTGDTAARAGTVPAFDVTLNLAIDCFVSHAQLVDTVRDLDVLIAQVKEGLFADPAFAAQAGIITNYRVARKFTPNAQMIIGQARIAVSCTWRDIYTSRIPVPPGVTDAQFVFGPATTTPPGATPLSPQAEAFEITVPLP